MTVLHRRTWLFAFWMLPAAIATLGFQVVPSAANPGLSLIRIFIAQVLMWQAWSGWTLIIGAINERLLIARRPWWFWLLTHSALCIIIVSAQILVIWTMSDLFLLSSRKFSLIVQALQSLWVTDGLTRGHHALPRIDSVVATGLRSYGDVMFVLYSAVVLVHAANRWYDRWQSERERAAKLSDDLAEARLAALRAQLNPHFLFNALNSIVTLIGRDPTAAQDVTVRLSELLRATLTGADDQQWSLAREVDLVRRYLEIEQVRFADRLTVDWSIAEGAESLLVPSFVLQPLVENAIRHGLARRVGPGRIRIVITTDSSRLVIAVEDDGPGFHAANGSTSSGAGIALDNLRNRLERLHGDGGRLVLRDLTLGGARVEVSVPALAAPLHVASVERERTDDAAR
jgi:sensor histidine kinase YesM